MTKPVNREGFADVSTEEEKASYCEFLLDAVGCSTAEDSVDAGRLARYVRSRLGAEFADGIDGFQQLIHSIAEHEGKQREEAVQFLAEIVYRRRAECFQNYADFEFSFRTNMNHCNGFTPLTYNQTFAYEIDGDELYLHLAPSRSVANQREEMRKAFGVLADMLRSGDCPSVHSIRADSHLVLFRPKLIELLGFTINSQKKHKASMTTQEFIERWGRSDAGEQLAQE